MSRDNAADLADDGLREFVVLMAGAGNPGAGRHEVGLRKADGWILEYDPTIGGFEVQAVVGIDGAIHARRGQRSLRTEKLTASEWIRRGPHADDPSTSAAAFADRLSRILTFNGVAGEASAEDNAHLPERPADA